MVYNGATYVAKQLYFFEFQIQNVQQMLPPQLIRNQDNVDVESSTVSPAFKDIVILLKNVIVIFSCI